MDCGPVTGPQTSSPLSVLSATVIILPSCIGFRVVLARFVGLGT